MSDRVFGVMTTRYYEAPIDNLESDLLNRKDLVEAIVDIVCRCDVEKSTAIGICGKWGSGKTSIINMVCNQIKNDKSIVTIRFNPWLYTNQTDLSKEFFNVFSSNLPGKHVTSLKKIIKMINKGTEALEPLCQNIPLFPLVRYYSRLLSENDDGIPLDEMKRIISQKLTGSKSRYLIIIDDLDRLDKSEILMILKLVRSLADFSNTIYILSYDEEIVAKATDCDIFKGTEYLQKIIHMPISVPEPDYGTIRNTLLEQYLNLIQEGGLDEHSYEIIYRCVLPFTKTLRDNNTLLNRFRIKYSLSKNNTHPAELLAITTLECFNPKIFKWICDNRYTLCGRRIPTSQEIIQNNIKKPIDFYQNDGMPSEYTECISALFPAFNGSGKIQNSNLLISEHRICHIYSVDNYFILTLPLKKITNEEVKGTLYDYDAKKVIAFLNSCSTEKGKLSRLLEELIAKYTTSSKLEEDRKRLLSDLLLFDEGYYTAEEVFRSDHQSCQLAGSIVKLYCDTLSRKDMLAYLTEKIPRYSLRAEIYWFWTVFHSDIFAPEEDDLKKLLQSVIDIILENDSEISSLPIEHDFIMLVSAASFVDPEKAVTVYRKRITTTDETKEYITTARRYNYSPEGLANAIPEEYRSDNMISDLLNKWYRVE